MKADTSIRQIQLLTCYSSQCTRIHSTASCHRVNSSSVQNQRSNRIELSRDEPISSVNLTASPTGKVGGSDHRIWKLTLSNLGTRRADGTQINIFSLTQS